MTEYWIVESDGDKSFQFSERQRFFFRAHLGYLIGLERILVDTDDIPFDGFINQAFQGFLFAYDGVLLQMLFVAHPVPPSFNEVVADVVNGDMGLELLKRLDE